MKNVEISRVFKAFDDENRLEILNMLKKERLSATQILRNVDLAQSTLSHHMKILCESGVVTCEKSGKLTYYEISADGLSRAMDMLASFGEVSNPTIKPIDEKVIDADDDDSWSKMVTFID